MAVGIPGKFERRKSLNWTGEEKRPVSRSRKVLV